MNKIVYAVVFGNGFFYTEDGFGGMNYSFDKAKLYDNEWEIGYDSKLKDYVKEKDLSYKVKKFRCVITEIQ